jgi:hypothetical protein
MGLHNRKGREKKGLSVRSRMIELYLDFLNTQETIPGGQGMMLFEG